MNKKERIKLIRAMETVVRSLNDENKIDKWLMCGVPDGEITNDTKDEDLEWLIEDKTFQDIMTCFVRTMKNATKDKVKGTLYCDGIVNKETYN